MGTIDWQRFVLEAGVLAEPIPDGDRVLLWLPAAGRDGGFRYWERVGNAARAAITTEQGVCSTEATSIQARQRVRGAFGKFLPRFRAAPAAHALTLPNGESAERVGQRQTDLALAWGADEAHPLDEDRVKARWPACREARKIGRGLYLVSGVEARGATTEPEPSPVDPGEQAERLLAAARQSGDRREQASALTDVGVLAAKRGDPATAFRYFEEALALARQIGDRSRQGDVVGNMGLTALATGDVGRALKLFEQGLAYARDSGDAIAEKLSLERIGLAYTNLGEFARALAVLEPALGLARGLGDRSQEADLLWRLGVQHAGLGQRDRAGARAQEAVDLLTKLGKPQAAWFAEHLQRYRLGDPGLSPGDAVAASPAPAVSGPGLLWMALTATQSMAKFLGSGFKTAPPATLRERLQTCARCDQHTGLRCKVCGCFTAAKAPLLHEDCPLGKWPA